MKAVYIQQHGGISDLTISEVPVPPVKPGEVLVRVESAGINPSDLLGVQGRFPHAVLPRIVGRDFTGVVVNGPQELINARVWGTGGDLGIDRNGTHAEFLAIPATAAARRPKNLSAEEAGSVGVPFIAAFFALVRLGQVKSGEWVIISGAAGAVGQAAIQLAHAKGAQVIALIRGSSDSWISKARGVAAVAQSDQANLETVVHDATRGRGADLALNGVGSSIFGSIMNSLGIGGRHVLYSAAGGREFPLDIMSFYRNQYTLLGLDTQKLDATQCATLLNELAPLFEAGALTPFAIAERHPLAEVAKAYAHVAAGAGKVVFVMDPGNHRDEELFSASRARHQG